MLLAIVLLFAAFTTPIGARSTRNDNAPQFEPVQVISTVAAVYPPKVVNWGTVVLNVTVDPLGNIKEIEVARAVAGFTDAAITAVRKWKFRPATLDGKPIQSIIPVAFSFAQPLLWHP